MLGVVWWKKYIGLQWTIDTMAMYWHKQQFWILFCVLTISPHFATTDKRAILRSWWNSTDPNKYELARRYVDYTLAFPLSEYLMERQICQLDDDTNTTAILVDAMLQTCANKDHFPNVLTASQVSMKKVKNVEKHQSSDRDIANNHSHTYSNRSTQKSQSDDDEHKIHRYLAFALVLPQHPFSRELVDTIRTVAPLYPHITFYFGIGYEYQDLCAQYGVRSFPKLLLFHDGLLSAKHGRDRDPGSVAYQLSKWTNELPRAIPMRQVDIRKRQVTRPYYHYNSSLWFAVGPTSSWVVKAADNILVKASYGQSVEPLVALSPIAVKWDFEIFIFSGLYVLVRLVYSLLWRQKFPGTDGG